jgi:hypothetical protein
MWRTTTGLDNAEQDNVAISKKLSDFIKDSFYLVMQKLRKISIQNVILYMTAAHFKHFKKRCPESEQN